MDKSPYVVFGASIAGLAATVNIVRAGIIISAFYNHKSSNFTNNLSYYTGVKVYSENLIIDNFSLIPLELHSAQTAKAF